MIWAYVNGNCKQAPKTQIATIEAYDKTLRPIIEPKGSDDEWNAFFGKEVFLNRDKGHKIVVAEFHQLATNRDDLAERVAAVHALGSFIVEASSGKSTEDRANCPLFMVNAIYTYETGLSPKRRSEIAAYAASKSSASTQKPGRMPNTEAQVFLCDMTLSIREAILAINSVRDAKGKKKYRVRWTVSHAYQERNAKPPRIDFPTRRPGRRPT